MEFETMNCRIICIIISACLVQAVSALAVNTAYMPPEFHVSGHAESQKNQITKSLFGRTTGGQDVFVFTLKNGHTEVNVTNYGGIIKNVVVPDRNGNMDDVILGFDTLHDYETRNTPYFGAIIGRYANRIAKGKFSLDGVNYTLAINDPPNALHGGIKGFDKRVWVPEVNKDTLTLTYTSVDGEEGYPGEVKVSVTYKVTSENELILDYRATTTKDTIINLTNHGYYNLGGQASGTISDHYVKIDAEYYTPVDKTSIPTGVIAKVTGTAFDLSASTLIGPRLPSVPGGMGYDINYALGQSGLDKHVARVKHPASGRFMDVYTTQPGVQFYTAYHLGNVTGKGGVVYPRFGALCLETQHYPDSPNEPKFPRTVLHRDEVFQQTTKYVFHVEE